MSAPPEYITGSLLPGHPAAPGSGLIPPEGRAFPLTDHAPASTGLAIWGNPFERKRNTLLTQHFWLCDSAGMKRNQKFTSWRTRGVFQCLKCSDKQKGQQHCFKVLHQLYEFLVKLKVPSVGLLTVMTSVFGYQIDVFSAEICVQAKM